MSKQKQSLFYEISISNHSKSDKNEEIEDYNMAVDDPVFDAKQNTLIVINLNQ
jgi:hypothetical protein